MTKILHPTKYTIPLPPRRQTDMSGGRKKTIPTYSSCFALDYLQLHVANLDANQNEVDLSDNNILQVISSQSTTDRLLEVR